MKTIISGLAASAVLILAVSTASAQDHSGHGGAGSVELPAACQAAKAPEMPSMENMQAMMEGMGAHQKAFMQGMMATEGPMMQGMMAEDADVAFACAMIPHHQGAINMAEVQLEHGDSQEMKEMAQRIIEAQKQEIEELTRFIDKQAQ